MSHAKTTSSTSVAKSWGMYLFAFLTAKGTAFLAPLGIAYISTPATYGTLELAFGYGLLLGPFLTLGGVVAAPQHMLMENDPKVLDRMFVAVLGAISASLLAACLIWVWRPDWWLVGLLVALSSGPSALQLAFSTYSRTMGWKSTAAWLDNTATHLLWITGVFLYLTFGMITISGFVWSYILINIAGVMLGLAVIWQYWTPPFRPRYQRSMSIGVPMMLNGMAIFFVTASARILIGTFLGPEALAQYAFVFRIAGGILLIHQFLMTAWAVPIYKDDNATLDCRIMWFCITMSGMGGVIFAALMMPFVQSVLPAFGQDLSPVLVGLCVVQVVLWSQSASLEPRVNRLLRAGRMSIVTAVIGASLCGAVGVIYMIGALSVTNILIVICVAQSVLILAQLQLGQDANSGNLQYTKRIIFVGPTVLIGISLLTEYMI